MFSEKLEKLPLRLCQIAKSGNFQRVKSFTAFASHRPRS